MGARFFAAVQTCPGAYPASFTMGTGSFPGVKRPGRGADHPPPTSAEVKERVELYLYSPSGPSWPVLWRTLPLPCLIIEFMPPRLVKLARVCGCHHTSLVCLSSIRVNESWEQNKSRMVSNHTLLIPFNCITFTESLWDTDKGPIFVEIHCVPDLASTHR